MTVKEIKDVVFGNYFGRIEVTKENSCYSMKYKKKIFSCLQVN